MPVVTVQDDRIGAGNAGNGREGRHGEAGITTRVIRIIAARRTIEIRPIEVLVALDEVDLGSDPRIVGPLREAPETRRLDTTANLYAEAGSNRLDRRRRLAHHRVQRHNDDRLHARRKLKSRETRHGFAESAAAREWRE